MHYVKEVTHGRIMPIGATALERSAKELVSARLGVPLEELQWKKTSASQQETSYNSRQFVYEDTSKNAER